MSHHDREWNQDADKDKRAPLAIQVRGRLGRGPLRHVELLALALTNGRASVDTFRELPAFNAVPVKSIVEELSEFVLRYPNRLLPHG